MAAISGNPKVMEFFPSTATLEQTAVFVKRMQKMYAAKGFCYFAVELLEDQIFIGFIGLCAQDYEAPFTPCVDIGWRLGDFFWNKGYATEGAKRCLEYAFEDLNLQHVKSVASEINIKSIHVMEKIGMKKELKFQHPKLLHDTRLMNCVCYTKFNNS